MFRPRLADPPEPRIFMSRLDSLFNLDLPGDAIVNSDDRVGVPLTWRNGDELILGGNAPRRLSSASRPSPCCSPGSARACATGACRFSSSFEARYWRRGKQIHEREMSALTDNENWIVERGGEIVEKKARTGLSALTDWEHLVYCLWVADYMMRNAGDFANAEDLYAEFQTTARDCARKLGLKLTEQAFSLARDQLQREYFARFEAICSEIRRARGPG